MIKKNIKALFLAMGLDIIKVNDTFPLHWPKGKYLDPKELIYYLFQKRVVIDVEVARGRGLPLHSYAINSLDIHPFSYAVSRLIQLQNTEQTSFLKHFLRNYYNRVHPVDSSEFIKMNSNTNLSQYPAWAFVFPWQCLDQERWQDHVALGVKAENQIEKNKCDIRSGWAWFGPVTSEKLEVEAGRILKLFQCISANGYKRTDYRDGDISADILVDENNDWVWQSVGGQHRAAVIAGLGMESIPVRVRSVIRRTDVESWPNVINGTYSVDQALELFDMVFNCDFDHITLEWKNYLKQQKE